MGLATAHCDFTGTTSDREKCKTRNALRKKWMKEVHNIVILTTFIKIKHAPILQPCKFISRNLS